MAVEQEAHKLEGISNLKNKDTVPVVYYEARQEDEINILDLWCVLSKRKWQFVLIWLTCICLGLSYAFMKPQLFTYYSILEIGSRFKNTEQVLIEQPSSLVAKIKSAYIPEVLSEHLGQQSSVEHIPEIEASMGKGSSIININIQGNSENQSLYFDLIERLTESIKKDHQRFFSIERKELELAKNRVENEILQIKERSDLLLTQKQRIKDKASLLQTRIINTKKLMEESNKNKQQALKNTSTEGKALVLMMIENDLREANNLLAELEEELHITLDNRSDELDNRIAQNVRNQIEYQGELAKIQLQLDNLFETRAIIGPMQSLEPVGKGKKIIVLVSVVAGFFLALFMVFFAEFLEKARDYAAEKNQSV